ncbi:MULTISPECIES: UTP--glucose-1-phosphate uridylyltransferase GalU [Francisella]|uniref:UTP--glucose-1-phosphate uridylyltransferase n=1 Tax=Francisella adeliensis TaxID=2007306 RepID=A0A2Z4XXI5_9GAMM|nr:MULTISPECIES: UTP--glucose-1-phosphate uridylyltransferase GalU [Francisella]AXA33479.1 UTP--glucose-1-phosphate uridylyltransferase [Francisella adeliensis]MBK2084826.1 UTP--glucose-1-phosphate uridylyltransferase GalU [Francisella adeliensis]MBK2097231.1 UTP--glucose-1-phosphate uridylyltransferase GalU [Francisella adeliensis]QIW11709.1 UTP--glucose-1-phosphate uridylyltransferase GalU [Francisella adeliensis]QIW13583.1 UTP--glucose-1-phosphate uridylyltransferase GalU [Francisella adeli
MKIRKAVFPVAGWGTRFLPATKSCPKEMLTVVDKPLIQYAVEEAIEAGCKELIFVTSSNKKSLEDHFDRNFELEYSLEKKQKYELLEMVKNIVPKDISFFFVRQPEALGLGHAVLCAKPLVGIEDFAVILPDDLIYNHNCGTGALKQMVKTVEGTDIRGCIATQQVAKNKTDSYGIVAKNDENIIKAIVEKPAPEKAPSTTAVVGRYLLPNKIFKCLESTSEGAGGEIQLTDAIAKLVDLEEKIIAHDFKGTRYDCGDKLGFLIANYEIALQHKELGDKFKDYLENR